MSEFVISKSKTKEFPVVIGEEKEFTEMLHGEKTVSVSDDNITELLPLLRVDEIYVLNLKKENFARFLDEIQENKGIRWILAPKSPYELVYNGGVPYFTYPDGIFIDMGYLKNLSPDDFFEVIAYAMRLGMEQSTNLYGFIINHLYELCDLDYDALQELFTMIYKVHERIMTKKTKEERCTCSLPEVMGEFYHSLGQFKRSDAIAFGCINGAYHAYRKGLLTMEDYYEIRDMFVPFGISITQTKINKARLLKEFREFLEERKDEAEILAMKKIGRLDQVVDFDSDLDEDLFEAVFFDEEAND